ncbi:MAG: efflux RND transporter periplasmic adaptor subunit [Candidatus Marinimicrobia bacterium]|nr:efflux RND transporter periplasmic adaptor subunit [Candidatus Neomarinimicrobiota bacterium]
MDREMSKAVIRTEKIKKSVRYLVACFVLVLLFVIFRNLLFPRVKNTSLLVATAEVGNIEGSITASGIVVPEFEQIITSPIQTKIESVYFRAGEKTIIDSSLLKLNTEFLEDDLQKQSDELELKMNRLKKLKIDMDRKQADLETSYNIQKLQLKSLFKTVEIKKQLVDIGVTTSRELELAELDYEIALAQLSQLEKQIENEKKSQVLEISDLELQIRIQKTDIRILERRLSEAKIRPEHEGVLAWINDNIGANVNAGDQIANIADLNSFKIEGKISDMHGDKLIIGNPVRVRIGRHDLAGNITAIDPMIQNGVISFIVELEDKTQPLLRSNLRVDVFVITSFKEGVIRIKKGPAVKGTGLQEIFVIEGSKAIRRKIQVGATNFDWAEIMLGVKAGEKVIISDMDEHIHKEQLKIIE